MKREELLMVSTALSIVQLLGGSVLTAAYASFLGWRLAPVSGELIEHAFGQGILLLCAVLMMLLLVVFRLLKRMPKFAQEKEWDVVVQIDPRCRGIRRTPLVGS